MIPSNAVEGEDRVMETHVVALGKLAAVENELAGVNLSPVPEGSGRARGEGMEDGWIHGLSMTRLVAPGQFNRLIDFPATASAIGGLMKATGFDAIHQVLVNRLEPGTALETHRDGVPFDPPPERWHLPVVTNSHVVYREDGNPFGMLPGWWWGPVRYWLPHSMENRGDTARLHLIVDLVSS